MQYHFNTTAFCYYDKNITNKGYVWTLPTLWSKGRWWTVRTAAIHKHGKMNTLSACTTLMGPLHSLWFVQRLTIDLKQELPVSGWKSKLVRRVTNFQKLEALPKSGKSASHSTCYRSKAESKCYNGTHWTWEQQLYVSAANTGRCATSKSCSTGWERVTQMCDLWLAVTQVTFPHITGYANPNLSKGCSFCCFCILCHLFPLRQIVMST